jgi:CRISPR/Cas system-associated exonuclease Cas4 (RecB family)
VGGRGVTVVGLDISQYIDAEPEVEEETWLLPIEHFSPTSIAMFKRCPEQFRQRYVLGRKERPGEALVIGTAVHRVAERNFEQKIESREDIPLLSLIEFYDDVAFPEAMTERTEQHGLDIAWDTDPDGARKRGRAITTAYQGGVAPRVQPISVETRVEADFGLQVPIIGYADCVTSDSVIDIKTGKTARSEIKPEWRLQSAVYGTITEKPVDFHAVAASTKDFRASIKTPLEHPGLSVWIPPEAREEVKRNVRGTAWLAQYLMKKLGPDEPWPTDGQSHPWACSYCGFRPGCPAWKGME